MHFPSIPVCTEEENLHLTSQFGHFSEKIHLLSLPRIKPQVLSQPACSLVTILSMPAHLSSAAKPHPHTEY
jgi:hypothetical protein